MKPTVKNPAIDNLIKNATGIDRKKVITDNHCALCGDSVKPESFKDALSLKEYKISGMCQKCQDRIFG